MATKNDEDFECPACRFLECFKENLKLTEEERKTLEKLEKTNPQEAIKYLEKIRTEEELSKAVKQCSIHVK